MAFDDPMIDGLSISALELRRQAALEFMSDGTAAGTRGGVRPGDPGFLVSLSGSTINVSAGVAALYFAGQGLYEVYGPASSPGTVAAAHATLDRIDLVYLRVWDNTVDSSGLTKADTVYLQGTAGSGTAPTPAGTQIYIPLATIAVPHVGAGSPSVTDARPITVGPGGIGAGPLPASGSYVGQWWDDGTGLKRWSGSAWSTGQFGAQIAVNSTDINQRPFQINAPSGLAAKLASWNVGATEVAFMNAAGNLSLNGTITASNITTGAWVSYTPTWTAATTNPTLGNGTLTGRYSIVGKTCTVKVELVTGSTTTFGSGQYAWALPFTSASTGVAVGAGHGITSGARWDLNGIITTSQNTFAVAGPTSSSDNRIQFISSTLGMGGIAWTTSNAQTMRMQITYELA